MENSWYSFDVPLGWMLLALLGAAGLAFLLYSKKGVPWSKNISLLMGILRMAALFLIALLLLNPLLKLSVNQTNQPIVVLALDNSESVEMRSETQEIKNWVSSINQEISGDYQTEYTDFTSAKTDTITFDSKTTNLSSLLSSIKMSYEGENVGCVVLASDGIVNMGALPQYASYPFPVYTLGLGDTIAPKDLGIHEVRNNRIAYQGNKFPMRISIRQKGFDQNTITLAIREGNKTLEQKNITLSKPLETLDFNLEAKEAGLKHLVVSVSQLDGESSYVNNRQDVYINVIEGKEKVLIRAPAPHPDISAIRKVLAEAANYETDLYIPGLSETDLKNDYDVIIEHNAFARTDYPKIEATGTWYITGAGSFPRLNQELSYLRIQPRGRQTDQVRPGYTSSFSKFKITPDHLKMFDDYPPLVVPFGNYSTSGPVEMMLVQKVGSVQTDRPMMFYYDDGTTKNAVTVGSGIWQWRLQEAGLRGDSRLFDEIVLKTVQFLSIKTDKKRFVVRPRQSTFNESERVFIDTEVYNQIYERSYGNTIKLTLTDESGKATGYELVDSEVNASFNLGRMNQGVYKFTASTTQGGKAMTESGEFIVKPTQIEALNLQADHQVLRTLSKRSGGKFFPFSEREALTANLKNSRFKSLITTEEALFPLINSLWIIGVIILLLSVEWFFRKYLGAY